MAGISRQRDQDKMESFFRYLYSRKFLLALLIISAIAFIISMWHRYAYIDDCFFGEQAYWLAKSGIVKTESIQVGLGWEERLFVYHKLNIWIGALIVKAFGWSVYYFKVFTLLVYLLFYFVLNKYLKSQQNQYPSEYFLMASLLVFANPLMFIYGFTYRPEILVMVFGFSSFIALENIRLREFKNSGWAMLAGVMSGFAFLSHLNGIIFGVSGFFYLLIYRKYKALPIYVLSALIVASVYFIDLLPAGNLEHFLWQLKNWPDAVTGNYLSGKSVLGSIIIKLASEHQRFFWSDKVMAFSGLFFLSLIRSYRHLKTNHRPLLIYTGLLILFLNLLGSHIAERYLIYYLPMMSLIMTISISHLLKQKRYNWLALSSFILLLQFGLLVKHWSSIMKENSDFTATHQEIGSLLPGTNPKVLAPYSYIFNEISKTQILTYHSLEYFEVIQNKKLSGSDALIRCKGLGIDYIIVANGLEKDQEKNQWFEPALKGLDSNYKVCKQYNGYTILSAIN